jgi:hypothetical protein
VKHDPDEAHAYAQEQRADQDFRPQHEPAYPMDTVEGHLNNARSILWLIRDRLSHQIAATVGVRLLEESAAYLIELRADVRGADARIAAGLAEYARMRAFVRECAEWFGNHGDGAPDAKAWEKDALNFEAEASSLLGPDGYKPGSDHRMAF